MDPVTLTTERLLLRPLEPGDVDAVLAACQDPDIQRWTTVPSPYEREHAEGFVRDISAMGWRNDTLYNFGVIARDSGVLVGSMGLVGVTPQRAAERIAEVGFWTAKEHRGQGYTAEAVTAVAHWSFASLGVDRLEWFAEAGNEGSRAVAIKVGFRMEGTLRSRLLYRGTRRDAWVGALLPSDLGLAPSLPYLPHLPNRPR